MVADRDHSRSRPRDLALAISRSRPRDFAMFAISPSRSRVLALAMFAISPSRRFFFFFQNFFYKLFWDLAISHSRELAFSRSRDLVISRSRDLALMMVAYRGHFFFLIFFLENFFFNIFFSNSFFETGKEKYLYFPCTILFNLYSLHYYRVVRIVK